jgi:predicted DNA-binding protein YlxM (UPF0122 family)
MIKILVEESKITMPNGVEYSLIKNGECWEFTGKLDTDRYPRVKVFGKSYRLNRVVLANTLNRDIKPGYLACHSCDNPTCLNPSHLWEGTPRENIVDAVFKGRITAPAHFLNQQGSKNKSAKLTESEVLKIRESYKKGALIKHLAEQYKVSRKTIQGAISGRYWNHVDDAIATNLRSGSRNHSSKLTEDQVIEIRNLYKQGHSGKILAKSYGVSDTVIYLIINRKTWKHI